MNRRKFIVSALAVAAVPGLLTLEGCPVSQSQLAALIGEVGAGLAEILPYLTSVSQAAAAKVEAAFQALETAVQNWKPGSVISVIEQAVNDFVSDMNLIPVLADYQPLVALIVATVEQLISLILPTSSAPATAVATGRVTLAQIGAAPKTASSFRSAWNKQVKANTQLAGLTIS
jgi:hypothetical protein